MPLTSYGQTSRPAVNPMGPRTPLVPKPAPLPAPKAAAQPLPGAGAPSPDTAATNEGVTGPIAVPGGQQQTTVPALPPTSVPTATMIPGAKPSTPTQGPSGAIPVPGGIQPMVEPPNPTGAVGGGPTLTPTDPNNPLTGQTITPGNTADRWQLAQQKFDQFVEGTDPAYKAALRDANRMGAAAGGLGSGQLRTNIGDLAATRGREMDLSKRGFLTDALEGSIGDAWKEIGLTQQQQGFQSEQQQRAFENELRRMGFDDDLLNSEFGRNLQTWMAGQTGGTGSGTILTGAGQAGDQGRDAMEALTQWLAERARETSAPTPPPAQNTTTVYGGQ